MDILRKINDEQPMANCSGMTPDRLLLDKSIAHKDFMSPKLEGILPSNTFLDTFNIHKFGKTELRLVGVSSLMLFLEISILKIVELD